MFPSPQSLQLSRRSSRISASGYSKQPVTDGGSTRIKKLSSSYGDALEILRKCDHARARFRRKENRSVKLRIGVLQSIASRDGLLPSRFTAASRRFNTPPGFFMTISVLPN